jgi:phosphatidylserine/phosphatidylglycerophosphate/cardiolipin synthase-like enzyme
MSEIELKVVMNTDDAFLVWRAPKLEGCIGFAIERQWRPGSPPARTPNHSEYLLNRVGFRAEPGTTLNPRQLSTVWPFQRYNWTDHEIGLGDLVRYRIVPVIGSAAAPSLMMSLASHWVNADAAQPEGGKLRFYFNRPMAASRWMARIAQSNGIDSSTALIDHMGDPDENELRAFCGGTLIAGLHALFDFADLNVSVRLYAALFELKDDEIIDRFCSLGQRASIVLANGPAKLGEEDRNEKARSRLGEAGCEVRNRMTATPGGGGKLAHNKFIVIERDGKPYQIWTGSTNLTTTGLFTQINNAVLVEDADLAAQYFIQWQRLAAAGNAAPATLRETNAAPGAGTQTPASIEPWFTPAANEVDLDRLRALVKQAKKGILFLSFMPGPDGPVLEILKERAKGCYVRGVLNQFVGGAKGQLAAALVNGQEDDPMQLDVITPTGLKQQLEFWSQEFTRGGSLSVLMHSKVLCIDPFSQDPVVVTGSHNFSQSASSSNDENFLIIQDNSVLARAYAAHIISVYNHYRWRAYVDKTVEAGHKPWQKLEDTPAWQDSRLASKKQKDEWNFWM